MSGMPPATAASNSRSTPAMAATSKSSSPKLANNSLLAVTTGLPDFSAVRINERAGSTPPITSTMTSTLGSATTLSASFVSTPAANETDRSLVRFCTATRATWMRTPDRRVIRSALASRRPTSAEPTLPHPRKPTRTSPSSLCAMFTILADRPNFRLPLWVDSDSAFLRSASPTSEGAPAPSASPIPRPNARGRRNSLGGPRAGRSRCARTPPPGGEFCCSWRPSNARTHRSRGSRECHPR